jgi:hypothetical protein
MQIPGLDLPVNAGSQNPADSRAFPNISGDIPESGAQSSAQQKYGPHPGYGPTVKILDTPCWLWARSLDEDGYGYFRRGGKVIRAHVHYYEQSNSPIPEGMELDHLCENRRCVNPDHLEPVTHLENCRRGRLVKTGMSIEKARAVRADRAAGLTYREISDRYGIGQSLIAQIVTNRCWKESPSPSPSPSPAAARGGCDA